MFLKMKLPIIFETDCSASIDILFQVTTSIGTIGHLP